MNGTDHLWAPLLRELPASIEPVIVSYSPDEPLGYAALEKRVKLPHEPFVLLGESFSGPLAVRIAARRPEHLKGLILVVTFLTNPWPAVPLWLEPFVHPALFRGRPPEFLMRRSVIDEQSSDEVVRLLHAAVAAVKPAVWAARIKAIGLVDVRKDFEKIAVPVLYLRAKRDRVVGPRMLKELREIRPESETVAIDGPHQILQTRPREAAAAIAAFVTRAAGAAR
jgi:pimeloyl-ACP methyl ester carboxylesterase